MTTALLSPFDNNLGLKQLFLALYIAIAKVFDSLDSFQCLVSYDLYYISAE